MSGPREIEDIKQQLVRHQHDHAPVRDLNAEADGRESRGDRLAADFARILGSWTFVLMQLGLSAVWVVLNVLAWTNHWDGYPFQLLDLVLTLEVAAWVPIALMTMNRAHARDRLRARHDYEVDVKGEEEMRMLMTHMEVQDDVLLQILHRLDRTDRDLRRIARRMGIGEEPGG